MLAHHSLCNCLVIFFILTIWIDTVVISMDPFRDREALREYGIEILDEDFPFIPNVHRENSTEDIEDVIHLTNIDVPSGSNIRRENSPKATADVINVSDDDVPFGSNISKGNTAEAISDVIDLSDNDVPSGSNVQRENTPEDIADVIDVTNDDVLSGSNIQNIPSGPNLQRENTTEDIRQLDDEGSVTSPKNWGIDASIEKLISITNLHATNPKIMTKAVMKTILGENELQNMVTQREEDFDAMYSLIPEKVKMFVFDYVNLHSHSKINESTFEDAVKQLFCDIRDGNKINEVVTLDSSLSEEENDVPSPAGENEVEDIVDETKPLQMDDVHTRPVSEPPEWMTCVPSLNCKAITEEINDDIPCGSNIREENRAEDIMCGSDIQEENIAEDNMDDINDDIPSGSNKRNTRTRSGKKITGRSSSLTKERPKTRSGVYLNLHLFKKPKLYPYEKKGKGKVELLDNSKIWIQRHELVLIQTCFKTQPKLMLRELLEKLLGKDNLPFMIWSDGEERSIPLELKESTFDFINLNVDSVHKMNQKAYKSSVLSILKCEKDKIRYEKTNSDVQKLEPPNSYPYQEKGKNKVELVIGSNIFIDKNELINLRNDYQNDVSTMIRLLLENLLGIKNMLSISWESYSSRYRSLPRELKQFIFYFINQNVIPEEKKDWNQYKSIVSIILCRRKRKHKGKPNRPAPEPKKLNLCPYQKKGVDKVELIKKTNIWISKKNLISYVKDFKEDPKKLSKMLLQSLIGKENLKEYSLSGNRDKIRIPDNIKLAIFNFVNMNVKRKHKITYETFITVISSFLQELSRRKEDVTLRPLEDSVNNTLESPEEYPYQIRGPEKVELTKGSNIWINKENLKTYTDFLKTNPVELMKFLLKNLFGAQNLPIFTWSDRKSRYKKMPDGVKKAIISYVNENVEAKYKKDIKKCDEKLINFLDGLRRTSAAGIVAKLEKQFDIGKHIHEKPETLPYEEMKKGKIELVPKSNVWIEKKELKKLNEDSDIDAARLINKLLEILLGKENIKFFSVKGKHPLIQLPTNVNDAIYGEFHRKKKVHFPNDICETYGF